VQVARHRRPGAAAGAPLSTAAYCRAKSGSSPNGGGNGGSCAIPETAGRRLHGTIKRIPPKVFDQVEQSALRPLPVTPWELAEWKQAKLHADCHVVFEARTAEVGPACAGFIEMLLGDRPLDRLRSAQAVLRLYRPCDAEDRLVSAIRAAENC
jgi:hypothetical protein